MVLYRLCGQGRSGDKLQNQAKKTRKVTSAEDPAARQAMPKRELSLEPVPPADLHVHPGAHSGY